MLSQHEIDKNVIKERQNSGGFIKNYAKVLFTNLNECFILPHNFDFDVKEFSEENADEYFITLLEEGIKFSEEEVAQWYEYLEKHNAKQSIKKIESYFILKEKNHLEKNLSQCKENKSNKTKLKV